MTNQCVNGQDSIIDVPWPASGQVRPRTTGFKDQVLAFHITVPFTFNPPLNINHLGFFRIAEVPGAAVTSRDVAVSFNPCDFQAASVLSADVGNGDTAPGLNYTVNNPNGYLSAGGGFNLNSGDSVYVSIRNRSGSGGLSCPNEACDVLFDFATPNRY